MEFDIFKLADGAKQQVAGILASEAVDRDNEVFDYDGSKKFFEKWAQDLFNATKKTAAPGEESYGNVRLMHGKQTVGKLVKIVFDDVKKTIWGIAEVTDGKTWEDIRKGVYSAFSIAGKLVHTVWKAGKKWITVQPLEVSIVDYPANPDTTFDWARGACFAKFAASEVVKTTKEPTFPPDATLTETPEFPKVDTEGNLSHNNLSQAENEKQERAMEQLTEIQKSVKNEVEKAMKSLHGHFAAMKSATASHAEQMNSLCDKCMKMAGDPAAFSGSETSGGQKEGEGSSTAATDTAVKAAQTEEEKAEKVARKAEKAAFRKSISDAISTLTSEVKTLKDGAVAKVASVVGDRTDLAETGKKAETEKAARVAEDKENQDLARKAWKGAGTDLYGDEARAAQNELYKRCVKIAPAVPVQR